MNVASECWKRNKWMFLVSSENWQVKVFKWRFQVKLLNPPSTPSSRSATQCFFSTPHCSPAQAPRASYCLALASAASAAFSLALPGLKPPLKAAFFAEWYAASLTLLRFEVLHSSSDFFFFFWCPALAFALALGLHFALGVPFSFAFADAAAGFFLGACLAATGSAKAASNKSCSSKSKSSSSGSWSWAETFLPTGAAFPGVEEEAPLPAWSREDSGSKKPNMMPILRSFSWNGKVKGWVKG